MSAAISPSGVASLRAKFEQKDEAVSPPSRGRSPAASLSVVGDTSRPISKVRTSFVSVEPSGQMGGLDLSEEVGNKRPMMNGDGAGDSIANETVEKPKTNGVDLTLQSSIEGEKPTPEQMKPKTTPRKDETAPVDSGVMNDDPQPTNPDKPNSTAEDKISSITSSDPKEAAAASDGPASGGETSPLGSILKGSPFEQDENRGEVSNVQGTGAAAEPEQSLEQKATGPSTPMTNGKPKEGRAQNAGLQSKTKTTPRPSATAKKPATQPVPSAMEKPKNKPQASTLPAPTTPKSAINPSKQAVTKKISPKSDASKEPKKENHKDTNKTTAERSSRTSVAPKVPAAAPKPVPKPGKKPAATSPPSFTKPHPKSPTRPVRLPGSATAPTAASAAKLDAAPVATAKPKDRVFSNPTSQRQTSARKSLSVGPKPVEKVKDKVKSRLSTASSKAPEGSFLDRMMRPTQSSSQKTHEKVEIKTPPKKTNGPRPKRKSDASEKARSEPYKTKWPHPKETTQSPPAKDTANSSEIPRTNEDSTSIDEAAPASATSASLEQSKAVTGIGGPFSS